MCERRFDLIAFDGDDTLWHNERDYRHGRERFRAILGRIGIPLSEDDVEQRVNRTEVQNLRFYGYGVSSFVLSLIETAIQITDGRITGREISELLALAKSMLTSEVELFEGAREALEALSPVYPLLLITKGDLLHQRNKLDRSGLAPYFRDVEVVSHKTPGMYAEILGRYRVDPSRFLMVGNSPRSDILPVLDVGGWAIHVPAALSWAHEHDEVPEHATSRYRELKTLLDLAEAVRALGSGQRG
ncbi:MAG TPA: HAD family hydrolase [Vicinamibacterales bacterium]|jgi:putative hydrolase of the HAD superfamily